MKVEIKLTSHALYILISNIRLTNIVYQMVKMNIRLQYKRIMFSDVGWVSDYVLKEKKKTAPTQKKQKKNIELRPLLKKVNELRKAKHLFCWTANGGAKDGLEKKKKRFSVETSFANSSCLCWDVDFEGWGENGENFFQQFSLSFRSQVKLVLLL